MIKPMGIRLPEEVLTKIEKISKEEMLDKSAVIRKLVMIGYLGFIKEKASEAYSKGKITFSEAAHQANLNLWEMEKYLIANGFKSNYSIEDLDEEMKLLG